ncbi:FDLD family class I lanthipeptide [Streptomyces sp. NPDC006654]
MSDFDLDVQIVTVTVDEENAAEAAGTSSIFERCVETG